MKQIETEPASSVPFGRAEDRIMSGEQMGSEESRQGVEETGAAGNGQHTDGYAESSVASNENATAAERFVGVAREQATQAADALRKGEFMRDPVVDQEASSDDRLIALLSYLTQVLVPIVMPVIVLLSESSKQRTFQRYHAVQSLALSVVFMAFGAAVIFGTVFMSIVPFIGWIFSVMGVLLLCLAPIGIIMVWMALFFYGYQAYQGKRFAIPGLTSFLRDQGWLE
jgi:uncharacterized membrane protein